MTRNFIAVRLNPKEANFLADKSPSKIVHAALQMYMFENRPKQTKLLRRI